MPRFCDRILRSFFQALESFWPTIFLGPWAFHKAWLLIGERPKIDCTSYLRFWRNAWGEAMGSGFKDLLVLFFTCRRWTHFDEITFQIGSTKIMKAFYFQHVQTIHGICVLYDAKKEQSLQNMLPRCDGNESQKTVLTHTCRVKSHVFSLECLSMDVFIKMIQGVFGLGNCVNYLFGHQGILVIGLIMD